MIETIGGNIDKFLENSDSNQEEIKKAMLTRTTQKKIDVRLIRNSIKL